VYNRVNKNIELNGIRTKTGLGKDKEYLEDKMFETLSTILKYIFAIIIYIFIYSIIRLIYLDIRSMSAKAVSTSGKHPYLKLLNIREELPFKVEEIYVLDGNKTIGRSNNNEFVIKDPFLSGEHAEFLLRDGMVYVKDRGSKNGTFVNNERIGISEVCINNGDRIQVGSLSFILVKEN